MKRQELEDICVLFTKVIKYDTVRPMTDLVELYSTDGVCHMGSTDGTTRIVATLGCTEELDNVVVSLSMLTKLLKLNNSEDISLVDCGDFVKFVGDGTYKIPIHVDEIGDKISLNLSMPKCDGGMPCSISAHNLALDRLGLSLYEGTATPMLNYYCNIENTFVSTNGAILGAVYGEAYFKQTYPNILTQISNLPTDFIYNVVDGGQRFSCGNIEIFVLLNEPTDFPVAVVTPFLDVSSMFKYKIDCTKQSLLDILRRADLFRDPFESICSIYIVVKDNVVTITNKKETCTDMLPYKFIDSEDIKIKTSLDNMIKCTRKMEKDIVIYLSDKCICLQDSVGFYTIANVSERG